MTDPIQQLAEQVESVRVAAKDLQARGKLTYKDVEAAVAVLTSWRGLREIRSKKQAERVAPRLVQILQERIDQATAALAEAAKGNP